MRTEIKNRELYKLVKKQRPDGSLPTYEEAAKAIGMSPLALSRLVSGQTIPQAKTAEKIAAHYKVDAESIFPGVVRTRKGKANGVAR